MAWTLPTPTALTPSFRPTWYQDCPNPTARRVVYDDGLDGDEEPFAFSFSNYGLDEQTAATEPSTDEGLPRGARLGRVARRAIQGLRSTLMI